MRQIVASRGSVVVVGPPKAPHLPGLQDAGLDERQLVWIQADTPAERLLVTEQLIKTNAAGLLVSWLPQARQEQIRRLQVCAQGCEGLAFLYWPAAARHEPSAAPLRVELSIGLDWELHVHLLKRKGPTHDGRITLRSVPGGLQALLTPRLPRGCLSRRFVAALLGALDQAYGLRPESHVWIASRHAGCHRNPFRISRSITDHLRCSFLIARRVLANWRIAN